MVSSHLSPMIIAGPTGSGKSALAIMLAQKHDGEIICADSRQFYRFMHIGTASPSEEEKNLVPHHGFNLIDPMERKIDAGFFIKFAREKIAECQHRNKRPIVVGGTGLYLRALRYGLTDVPQSDKGLVAELEKRCEEFGLDSLYNELIVADPDLKATIQSSDRYRIIRALEIFHQTGIQPSQLRRSFSVGTAQLSAHWLLRNINKATFALDLSRRIMSMIERGLIEEAQQLRTILPQGHWALTVMGYEEALLFVDGHMSKAAMIERILIRHRQYAKRQATWFRRENFYRWHI